MKPLLVLGVGNVLLRDDGIGPRLVSHLARAWQDADDVEFVDGGTQGLSLLGLLHGRRALLVLDAFRCGGAPGSIAVLDSPTPSELGARKSETAHEGNAGELLSAAALTGDLPDRVCLLGVEPQRIEVGLGLSEPAEKALPGAIERAEQAIRMLLGDLICV